VGGEIISAAFDEQDVEVGENRAMSALDASRFTDASSRIAVCGQPPVSTPTIRSEESTPRRRQELRVLARVNYIRNYGQAIGGFHRVAERFDERRLSRSHRAADADFVEAWKSRPE